MIKIEDLEVTEYEIPGHDIWISLKPFLHEMKWVVENELGTNYFDPECYPERIHFDEEYDSAQSALDAYNKSLEK